MNTFGFEQFELAEANQTAFDVCREVAALRYSGPRPVLLLGPDQCGKTHLLWAIVKRVRASAVKTSLALIMAREFPEKVRGLLKDATPIRGRPAIFLVDELDQFREHVPELEAVTRLFLEHGHQVVVASCVHPDRLPALSPEFKALLRAGRIIEIGARQAPARAPAAPASTAAAAEQHAPADYEQLRQELEGLRRESADLRAQAEALRKERNALEEKLAGKAKLAGELGTVRSQSAEMQTKVQSAEAERARLEKALSDEREAAAAREASLVEQHRLALAACEAERNAAVEQRDLIEKQLTEAWQRASQADRLRALLTEAQEDASAAFAQQARLQGQVGALKLAAEDAQALRSERDAIQAALAEAETRAGEVLEHLLARRNDWLASFAAMRDRIAQNGDGECGAPCLESAGEEAFAAEMLEEARASQGRLQVTLDAAQARLRAVESELEELRHANAAQSVEMEALRASAARRGGGPSASNGE